MSNHLDCKEQCTFRNIFTNMESGPELSLMKSQYRSVLFVYCSKMFIQEHADCQDNRLNIEYYFSCCNHQLTLLLQM